MSEELKEYGVVVRVSQYYSVQAESEEEAKEYHIGIYGENATVKTSSGNVIVNSSVSNNISTQSGRVVVHGYVNGNVSTMSGRVEVGGKVSGNISTMSGSIRHG